MISNACQPNSRPLNYTLCKNGYYRNGSTCLLCNTSEPSCVACAALSTNNVVCTRCKPGYALDEKGCKECQTGCLNCQTTTYCLECKLGYVMQDQLGISTGRCVSCSPNANCQACFNSPSQCLVCRNNFVLQGFKCIS